MYKITSFKIDERCLTPGALQRGEDHELDIASILPENREGGFGGDVFIHGGEAKFGYFTVKNILQWGMGESLGHKCFVILDGKIEMTFNEYWEHGNAYYNYIAMRLEPEYHSETSMQNARRNFERAVLVYSAHELGAVNE
jgi:hypothetical protein